MKQELSFDECVDIYRRHYDRYVNPDTKIRKPLLDRFLEGFLMAFSIFTNRKHHHFGIHPKELSNLSAFRLNLVSLGVDIVMAKENAGKEKSLTQEQEQGFRAFHDYVEKSFNIEKNEIQK